MNAIGRSWTVAGMATILLGTMGSPGRANPIPWPPCSENIEVEIAESTGTLRASFMGEFRFVPQLPDEITTMTFPLPPDAQVTRVDLDGFPCPWRWVPGAVYPTQVPEQPVLPMIGWDIPPGSFLVYLNVDYNHALIPRGNGYIFLYALGSGKYSEGLDIPTDAYFTIGFPPNYRVASVSLDNDPWQWSLYEGKLRVGVTSQESPETRDLLVRLAPRDRLTGWLAR